jgi:stage V sporulation protein B
MIPTFLSIEMLGFYAGAYLIVGIPKIITHNIATALIPFASEKSDNLDGAKREYFAFLTLFLLLSAIGYALFIYFANFSLILLPSEYSWITPVIQILLVGMFFSDIFLLNATFISSLRKEKILKEILIFIAFVVVINIVLNYIFIPKLGIEGAAISTAISFILIGAISMVQVVKMSK